MSLPRGRPTKKSQQEISDALKPCFERGLSAAFTARQTGHDIKTVCNYFNDWSKQMAESDDGDFIERQELERQRVILSFDNLISEEYQLLDELKSEIKIYKDKKKRIPNYFTNLIQNCIKTIYELTDKKTSFTLVVLPKDITKQYFKDVT